ncbi:MAG: protease pro-enzyme activation domain-containing protein [Candidatus Acidiferrales bacterium]
MRIQRSTGWKASLVFASILVTAFVAGAQTSAVAPRITQAIDETNLVTLKGNTLPMARAEFDQGLVSDSLPLEKMLLVLQRSPAQESALRSLLDQQQDKTSPNYHKWLTPEQYGQQYGPADADIQTVTNWLQGHGFTVDLVTKGKTIIEFTGTAGLVRNAFHTEIHNYLVNGEKHIANSSDPQIPAALAPVVAGVASLHDFFPKPHFIGSGKTVTVPAHSGNAVSHLTDGMGDNFLGPLDFAKIYNIDPLYTAGTTGSGRTIAVLEVTDIVTADVTLFDEVFGLTPHLNVIHNGTDPGDLEGGDRTEATLDAEWAGGIGQGATIDFVVSKSTSTFGTDLSAIYVNENNLADVMSTSYGGCEPEFTLSEAEAESLIGEQAAAQGITYMAAQGDSGAEDCATSETAPANGAADFGVDLPGATPFVVSVGGTEFNEGGNDSLYWGTSATADETALSYIPEDVWNDSCTPNVGLCGAGQTIVGAGGGGASIYFSKPSWQTGFSGTPTDTARDVPDVSFTASAAHDPYIFCVSAPAGMCAESGDEITLQSLGGTSFAAPSFAGIMSIVDQATDSRQGDANYVLYNLAKNEETFASCNGSGTPALSLTGSCIFNDATVGNNAVPGEVSYGTGSPLYVAGTGYDKASGLGSTNVNNLITNWHLAAFTATTTTMTGVPGTATTGQSIPVSISVTSGGGTPTGDVSVLATSTSCGAVGVPLVALSGGAANTSFSLPFAGTYSVVAHYAGNGNFGASNSSASIVAVTGTACSGGGGGGGTFSAAANPKTASIATPGGTATSTITVSGNGFTGTVTLTCSVSPANATDTDIPSCSFNSPATSSVALSVSPGTNPTATLNISSIAASGTFIPSTPSRQFPMHTVWLAASLELALACLFLLTAPAQKKRWGLLFAVGVLAVVAGAVGCGSSGGSSGGGGGGGNPGTTPDTYTVTVSAGSGGTTETATFTVTVQ